MLVVIALFFTMFFVMKFFGKVPRRPLVFTPAFHPPNGELVEPTTVRISCATRGATIYYTLDGTDPVSNSVVYDSQKPPVVGVVSPANNKPSKLRMSAIARKKNMDDSDVAVATYTILPHTRTPPPTAPAERSTVIPQTPSKLAPAPNHHQRPSPPPSLPTVVEPPSLFSTSLRKEEAAPPSPTAVKGSVTESGHVSTLHGKGTVEGKREFMAVATEDVQNLIENGETAVEMPGGVIKGNVDDPVGPPGAGHQGMDVSPQGPTSHEVGQILFAFKH